jgi:hypothetical protein
MLRFILIFFSLVSQYSPGMMEQVIVNRQTGNAWVSLPQVLPLTDGYIAVKDCAELGNIWWAQNPVNEQWESFLIVDCAAPNDGTIEWMDRYSIAFEVDYETAVRWNTVGRGVYVSWAKENPNDSVYWRLQK